MKNFKSTQPGLMVLVIFAVTVMFLPTIPQAGELEPSAPPASTMRSLDELPPTWSKKLPPSERFKTTNVGVLDRETGLVWQRLPSNVTYAWASAMEHCFMLENGNLKIKGWHLPSIEQLASLVDLTHSQTPKLPLGHPFSNIISDPGYTYLSSTDTPNTSSAYTNPLVYAVSFSDGEISRRFRTWGGLAWCVRGESGWGERF